MTATVQGFDDPRALASLVPRTGKLLLVTDKDGTLDPFVSDPNAAFVPEQTRGVLSALNKIKNTRVAVVSGRSLEQLEALMGRDPSISYVGMHGSQCYNGDTKTEENLVSTDTARALASVEKTIRELLEPINAIDDNEVLELKNPGVCLHWRRCPEQQEFLTNLMQFAIGRLTAEEQSAIRAQPGNMVVEVKATRTKADALSDLVIQHSPDFVVCIGDDLTDIHMMRSATENLGHQASLNVIVGADIVLDGAKRIKSPKETLAFFQSILAARQI